MSDISEFNISDTDGVVRVDKYLAAKLPEYSRAALHKLFAMGLVQKDGKPLKAGEKLRPGQHFTADVSLLGKAPDKIDLPILYEDKDVLVIDKPPGVISHARGRYWQEASVASFLRYHTAKNQETNPTSPINNKAVASEAISYVMGCDDSVKRDLKQINAKVNQSDGAYQVAFDAVKAKDFVAIISQHLKPGFWNEYITADRALFIFKDTDGVVTTYPLTPGTNSTILNLCRKFAKTAFESINSMLKNNDFYASSPILDSCLEALDSNISPERIGIVHRLDRGTSGVMICAKNPETMRFLQKQFHDRQVEKTYIAITSKQPKLSEAVIDAPIARDLKDPKKFIIQPNGKTAQTHYQVLRELAGKKFLIKLTPKTGRTHQLRVHLAYIGCPIVGDLLYEGKKADRLFLHAKSLQIKLPSGEDKLFESPLPEVFHG